ncbi:MAG: 30S ribosomal protein S6 [Candidatus Pacebacteria bacterium]|nr:30S ribosomal protein S6 [Candidatus Paceibacterota bacterium]
MQDSENNMTNNEEMDLSESPTQIYEVGYLLVPTTPEEQVPALYSGLKDLVASLKGEAIADEMPKMIPLAYPMTKVVYNVRSKFSTAYFGWIKFSMPKNQVLELKKKLDLDVNVIRFLILKTVKENTIAAKRFVGRDSVHKRAPSAKKEGEEESAPMNKEEVDKEIDAMIAA